MTGHGFALDPFQLDAIAALDEGLSVLVAAPTGSGKTVVADAAVDMALHSGGKAFYTTPIKALSNQKYNDLVERLGRDRVGLLTGDTSINGEAPVVVMTTEVLRNMLYAGSDTLRNLHVVVLDEVHYLQDAYRGPVWEEVIIELPPNVRLVCLSATVSNVDELGAWIETVRGPTATIVEHERPVELENLYMVADKAAEDDHLIPILLDGNPNPAGYRFDGAGPGRRRHPGGGRHGARGGRWATPRRIDVVERLQRESLLPAIYFIFSRNACDDALAICRDAGLRFTNRSERLRIREILDRKVDGIGDADLDALGFDLWAQGLEAGIASHHAGLIPAFKEAVEQAFIEGLVKVVFATETLALGVNMPARSVVIEKLTKYNGEGHEFLTPAQYTQLTGRAGRRGIDTEGYAVVLWSPFVGFGQVASLAMSREYPLTSSFRPTYNMSANLVRRMSRSEAMSLLGQSFAQYQADRNIVGLERRLVRDRERHEALLDRLRCDCGDVLVYADLRDRAMRERRHRPDGRPAIDRAVGLLRPGAIITPQLVDDTAEVLELAPGEAPKLIVISVAHRSRGTLRVRCLDTEGRPVVLTADDFAEPPRPIVTVDLPLPWAPKQEAWREQVVDLLVTHDVAAPARRGGPSRWERLLHEMESHPVHRCPRRDDHVEAVKGLRHLERSIERIAKQLRREEGSVARRFDAVCDVLGSLGCIDGWDLTERGERLSRIYHECDLLIALALDDGAFDGLSAAELAAVVSAVVWEERRNDGRTPPGFPNATTRRRFGRLSRIAESIARAERQRGLPPSREPDPGFMQLAHGWASGVELSVLLDDTDMSGGDFVRTVRLVVDLLSQLAEVSPDLGTRKAAADAVAAMRRGVVADGGPTGAE